MGHPGIRVGDAVSVVRAISRREDANYAVAGETGVVTETFKASSSGDAPILTMHAKVKMNLPGKPIKTFRLTSLMRK